MRKIKIKKWTVKNKDGQDTQESLVTILSVLLANKDPKEMPRGLDNFRLYGRLSKAFTKAEKTDILTLEETDYKFLKDIIEKDVIALWGINDNMAEAVEAFVNAEIEKPEEQK